MKRVTVVGSGNAFNSDGRAHAAYLLENESGKIALLDCGATTLYRLQQMRFESSTLCGVLLTHFHGDHFGGLPFLLLDMQILCGRKDALWIAGPAGVEAAVRALLAVCYPGYWPSFPLHFEEIGDGETRGLAGFTVEAIAMDHQPESLGYRLRGEGETSMAFSGDARLDASLQRLVDGVDLALVELTMERQSDPPVAHIALDEIESGRFPLHCRRLVFTHIYDDLAAAVRTEALGETAFDGAVYELSQ